MSITATDVTCRYGSRIVLDRVSLDVPPGTFMSVLGANGSGKSTLLRCMLGILKYDGTITIAGRDISAMTRRDLACVVSYIPQSSPPPFHFTVLEMALMGATSSDGLFAAPFAKHHDQAHQALDTLGITHLAHRDFLKISGGERQLTMIARALAAKATIFLLDEPTASLDYGHQYAVLVRLHDLTTQGCTIIMTTHHPTEAAAFSTKAAALINGKLVVYDNPKDIQSEQTIQSIYGVPRWDTPACISY